MRRAALLLVCVLSNIAFAQNAPSHDAKPKGKIVDPFARMPHPRDGMKLPDPRAAAERAAEEHDANAPASSQPAPAPAPAPAPPAPVAPSSSSTPVPDGAPASSDPAPSQITVEPAATGSTTSFPTFGRSRTPFGVTKMRIKTQNPVDDPPAVTHDGLTLEAGTGAGWIAVWADDKSTASPGGVAGLSLGIGGWINESVALTARLSGSSVPSSDGVVVAGFLGPSMQIWATDRTWFGAGLGLATFGRSGSSNPYGGYGADLRIGHTFYANGKHTLNGSLELTPSHVSREGAYGYDYELNVASIGALLGWQYL